MVNTNLAYKNGPDDPSVPPIVRAEYDVKSIAQGIIKQLRIEPRDIELLLVDLDQTIIAPPDYEVPPFTQGVFSDIKRKTTIQPTIMTGRNYGSAEPYLDPLGITTFFIATHGARVQKRGMDPLYLELVHHKSAESIHGAFYQLRTEGLTDDQANLIFIQGNVAAHEQSDSRVLRDYLDRNGGLQPRNEGPSPTFDVYQRNGLPEKIVIATDSQEIVSRVKRDLQKMVEDVTIQYLTVNGTQLEIIRSDVNKGAGARHILQKLRLEPQNALAFGDGYTDLTVAYEGIPLILLGNAPEDVKAAAKDLEDRVAIVPLTVDNQAVAEIARALFLNGLNGHSH